MPFQISTCTAVTRVLLEKESKALNILSPIVKIMSKIAFKENYIL